LGAHTANEVPVMSPRPSEPRPRTWEPSTCHSSSCRPSPIRCRSNSPSVGRCR
jgi:hypothetical protein